jgi:hypothetical protein
MNELNINAFKVIYIIAGYLVFIFCLIHFIIDDIEFFQSNIMNL